MLKMNRNINFRAICKGKMISRRRSMKVEEREREKIGLIWRKKEDFEIANLMAEK